MSDIMVQHPGSTNPPVIPVDVPVDGGGGDIDDKTIVGRLKPSLLAARNAIALEPPGDVGLVGAGFY